MTFLKPIWKCEALLKFKMFAWKAALDRCWTGERHLRHKPVGDNTCPMCLHESESIANLLIQCVL